MVRACPTVGLGIEVGTARLAGLAVPGVAASAQTGLTFGVRYRLGVAVAVGIAGTLHTVGVSDVTLCARATVSRVIEVERA